MSENADRSGVQELLVRRNTKIELKLSIATKSELILQDPESNLHLLRDLVKSLESTSFRKFKDIRILLVASLSFVFKDILPSYRIRPITEKEKKQAAKKETKIVRHYEENLLLNYRKYIQLLRIILEDKLLKPDVPRLKAYMKHKWSQSEKLCALKCVCKLYEEHPNFNFSDDLLRLMPIYLNKNSPEICRCVHKYCRSKSYLVKDSLIKALKNVSITEVDSTDVQTNKVDRSMKSRKERKKDKLERKFEKAMTETKSSITRDKRLKMSTTLRDGLFCVHTALTILTKTDTSDILATDPTRFYNHLYTLLGQMSGVTVNNSNTSQSENLTLTNLTKPYSRSNTPAAQAVNQYLRRSAITKDTNSVKQLDASSLLPSLSKHRICVQETEQLTDITINCLNLLLIKRKREVSTNRALAFIKRLSGCVLSVADPYCSSLLLLKVIQLLYLFPRAEVLFDSETEIGGSYRPEMNNPELCLPASACLWELDLAKHHCSSIVRQLAHIALTWNSDVVRNGTMAASTRQHSIQVGSHSVGLNDLFQLSPDACRAELTKLDDEDRQSSGRKRPKAARQFGQHFRSWLDQFGSDLDVDIDSVVKKRKVA